jgi:flagellar biosynthesis protein FlhG
MNSVIPVASGKGGVGKTIVSANLGVALARHGKTVILVDLDLGGSNLHTCLGIRNNHPGLGSYIYRKSDSLESLIVDTDQSRLYLIPGDALLPGTANLPFFVKNRILKELPKLAADMVVLDLGSGSSFNTIDFFLSASNGIVVTTPETTAVLNAYSFLKTALYRALFRGFPARSRQRELIQSLLTTRIEGVPEPFLSLIGNLAGLSAESGRQAREILDAFKPRVILNMLRDERDAGLGRKLEDITRKNLGVELSHLGSIGLDPAVGRSVIERKACLLGHPECDFSLAIDQISQLLIKSPVRESPRLFSDPDELVIPDLRDSPA